MKSHIQTALMVGLFIYCGWVFIDLLQKNQEALSVISNELSSFMVYFFIALVCFALSIYIRAYRWAMMLGQKDALWLSVRSISIGYLVQCPLSKLGEVARIGNFKKSNSAPLPTILSTVFVDRILDMVALLAILIYALFSSSELLSTHFPQFKDILPKLLIAITVALCGIPLFIYKKQAILRFLNQQNWLPHKIKSAAHSFTDKFSEGFTHTQKPKEIAFLIFSTVFIWFLYLFIFYVIVYFFPHIPKDATLNDITILFCIGTIGILIPVPGGLAYPIFLQKGMEVIWPSMDLSYIIALATLTYLFNFWVINIILGGGCIGYQALKTKKLETA